jgi:amidohydrolase
LFQPSEETLVGARQMVEAGALANVAVALALHVDPSRSVGRVGLRSGVFTANCDALSLEIRGRGGHAARPHETIDPIAIAAQLITALYALVPRSIDSQEAVVLSIGQIHGGESRNVIPDSLTMAGTLRTLDERVRQRTIEHMRRIVQGAAEASGAAIDLHVEQGIRCVVNDAETVSLVRSAATDLLGGTNVADIERPSMGSEDFASYLEHVPGCMFRLGCASADVGSSPLHTPTFDIDERALAIGAKLLARAAIRWFDPARAGQRDNLPANDIQREQPAIGVGRSIH